MKDVPVTKGQVKAVWVFFVALWTLAGLLAVLDGWAVAWWGWGFITAHGLHLYRLYRADNK